MHAWEAQQPRKQQNQKLVNIFTELRGRIDFSKVLTHPKFWVESGISGNQNLELWAPEFGGVATCLFHQKFHYSIIEVKTNRCPRTQFLLP